MNVVKAYLASGARRNGWYGGLLVAGVLGCSGPSDAGQLPPDVRDPAEARTPAGAMATYRAALVYFRGAMDDMLETGELLSDEVSVLARPIGSQVEYRDAIDGRLLGEDASDGQFDVFSAINAVRSQTREARGFLHDFAPDSSPALRGHLYAIEAYMNIALADLFCSGIPLSTIDYGADFTLAPGSSTAEVYHQALELLDTALTMTADSVRLHQLAAVGSGRALLALEEYEAAAAAVAVVPTDYTYGFIYDPSKIANAQDQFHLWRYENPSPVSGDAGMTMSDREGTNGLDYRSSGDPRTAFEARWTNSYGSTVYRPNKYSPAGLMTVVIASGIEARLIQAEAALHAGGSEWLTILNTLRTDGTFDTQPNATDPEAIDTLWRAGSGKVAGLAPLQDPATFDARVDLLFRERAFWLYYTGIRLGDMRRLVRAYRRAANAVFPIGVFPAGAGLYGNDVNVPVPDTERQLNSKYTGCIHRDA